VKINYDDGFVYTVKSYTNNSVSWRNSVWVMLSH